MTTYTSEEKAIIKDLMHTTTSTVMQKRYLVLHMHMQGHTNQKIAGLVGLSGHTVGTYVNTYKSCGLDALVPKKPPGRPPFLSAEQEQKLYKTISENAPDEVGFDGIKNWTAKVACHWVSKEFGVHYKASGMLDLFHRLGLSWTRPTYVLAKADPEKQEAFKDDFEEVKKTDGRENRAHPV